jgi:hypothetical protein
MDLAGAFRICHFTFFTPLIPLLIEGGKSFLFPPINKGRVRMGIALCSLYITTEFSPSKRDHPTLLSAYCLSRLSDLARLKAMTAREQLIKGIE